MSIPAGSAVPLALSRAATRSGVIWSWPFPASDVSAAGMAMVTVPAATCVVRMPRRRERGGQGRSPLAKARTRSMPLRARNHGGGMRPRTGSSGITLALPTNVLHREPAALGSTPLPQTAKVWRSRSAHDQMRGARSPRVVEPVGTCDTCGRTGSLPDGVGQ
jgi:hypothetical protein